MVALRLTCVWGVPVCGGFLLWRQEEEALLSEMDVTGQAFEDMQEQNSRLLTQLREKDDANFKLMSERIKSNQIYKLLREEKEELADQVLTFKTQVSQRADNRTIWTHDIIMEVPTVKSDSSLLDFLNIDEKIILSIPSS